MKKDITELKQVEFISNEELDRVDEEYMTITGSDLLNYAADLCYEFGNDVTFDLTHLKEMIYIYNTNGELPKNTKSTETLQ